MTNYRPSFTGKDFAENLDQGFKDFTFVIPANDQIKISRVGRYFKLISNSGATASLEITLDQGDRWVPRPSYEYQTDEFFRSVMLYNTTGASITVTVMIGNGVARDPATSTSISSSTSSPVFVKTTGSTTASGTDISATAGAATVISASATTRRSLFIGNPATSGVTLRVDNAPTATRGIQLPPGAVIELLTTAAISVFNPGGSAINVNFFEIRD